MRRRGKPFRGQISGSGFLLKGFSLKGCSFKRGSFKGVPLLLGVPFKTFLYTFAWVPFKGFLLIQRFATRATIV